MDEETKWFLSVFGAVFAAFGGGAVAAIVAALSWLNLKIERSFAALNLRLDDVRDSYVHGAEFERSINHLDDALNALRMDLHNQPHPFSPRRHNATKDTDS